LQSGDGTGPKTIDALPQARYQLPLPPGEMPLELD